MLYSPLNWTNPASIATPLWRHSPRDQRVTCRGATWPSCDRSVTQRHAGNGKLRGLVTNWTADSWLLTLGLHPVCGLQAEWNTGDLLRSPPWLWPRLVLIRREWKYSKETLIVHALTQNSCPDIYPSIIKKPRCLGSWWMYSVKQIWVHVLVDVWYGYVVSGGNKRVIIVNSFH